MAKKLYHNHLLLSRASKTLWYLSVDEDGNQREIILTHSDGTASTDAECREVEDTTHYEESLFILIPLDGPLDAVRELRRKESGKA